MSYSKTKAAVSAVLGIASVWAPAQAVWAQAAAAPEADTLQEVIITAERRATDVQTTPIAVTAVSGDELVSKQITTLASLSTAAPSISMYDRGGTFTGINIRGIGNSSNVPAIQSGVAVIRDGTYLPEPLGHNVPFYDIADAEVLRGPQGTFVGASAIGGALLINSKSPSLDGSTSGFATYEIGDYSLSRFQGAVNLPIGDTLAARIAINSDSRGSYYKDANTILAGAPTTPHADPGNSVNRNVRVGLRWKPNEKLDALFKYENNMTWTDGSQVQVSTKSWAPLVNTGNCTLSAYSATTQQVSCAPSSTPIHGTFWSASAPYNQSPYNLTYDEAGTKYNLQQIAYTLDTRFTFDNNLVLRSITGHRHLHVWDTVDADASAAPRALTYHEVGPNNNYYSQEFTLASPDDQRVSWIGGAFFFYRDTVVRSATYTYNLTSVNASGTGLGYDGKIYACTAPGAAALGAVPSGCAVAAPGTPIMANFAAATVNGVALPALTNVLQGYVPSYIIYNGQQISQLAQNSQGNAQRMAAIFGKVSFKINDQLDFEAGLRYSWDSNFQYSDNSRLGTFSVSYQRDLSGGSVAANPNYGKLNGYMQRNCTAGADPRFAKTPLGSGGDCLDTRASIGKPDHEPSYKVGLNWKPQDGQFGYLFYAHGYKAAGLNSQQNAPSLRSFDVEKVDDFEAGWKSKWLNNRVNTSVGVYYTMDKGFQFNLFDPVTTNTAVGNLGGTTALYGLELTANAKLSGWVIDANLAITKSKLGTAIQAPTYLLGALVNGTVTAGVAGGTAGPINLAGGNSNQCSAANTAKYCVDYSPYLINVSGETNPLAPQMTATLQVGYEFLMGNGTLRPRVNYSYSGVAYGSLFQNVDTFAMRARGLVNVNLDYENGPWSTSAYVTNLTNVWYETDSSGNASSPYATTWWGPPRQVGVRFTRKF